MDLIDEYCEQMRELQNRLLNASTDRSLDGSVRSGLADCATFAGAMARRLDEVARELEGGPF